MQNGPFQYINWPVTKINVVEYKYKVALNGNIQVKYKYLKVVLKYSTWVNVLSYIPPLESNLLKHLIWNNTQQE